MEAVSPIEVPKSADQRVFLTCDWAGYEGVRFARGAHSVPRIAYLHGWLEIMSPSVEHEELKERVGRLVEAWAHRREIDLAAYGSRTVRSPSMKRAVEPDKCYIVGAEGKAVPDLAIEIVWTAGGIDKLDIYWGLHVPELWFWESGKITVNRLLDDQYIASDRSALLPGIDLARLSRCALIETTTDAVDAFLDNTP
jgi:Uma2 family endonuclease